jgi:hypothetical protein
MGEAVSTMLRLVFSVINVLMCKCHRQRQSARLKFWSPPGEALLGLFSAGSIPSYAGKKQDLELPCPRRPSASVPLVGFITSEMLLEG